MSNIVLDSQSNMRMPWIVSSSQNAKMCKVLKPFGGIMRPFLRHAPAQIALRSLIMTIIQCTTDSGPGNTEGPRGRCAVVTHAHVSLSGTASSFNQQMPPLTCVQDRSQVVHQRCAEQAQPNLVPRFSPAPTPELVKLPVRQGAVVQDSVQLILQDDRHGRLPVPRSQSRELLLEELQRGLGVTGQVHVENIPVFFQRASSVLRRRPARASSLQGGAAFSTLHELSGTPCRPARAATAPKTTSRRPPCL